MWDAGSTPGLGRSPWRRAWQPTLVFLPGEFHGQRSLVGYSPWGCKALDMTEQLTLSLLGINRYTLYKLNNKDQLFVTPWTGAYQAPPCMEFSRQEYWGGFPFPSPGDLPDSGIKPRSFASQADTLPSEQPGKPTVYSTGNYIQYLSITCNRKESEKLIYA